MPGARGKEAIDRDEMSDTVSTEHSGIAGPGVAHVPMVTIGKIIGTHGVGGEVKVTSYSDVPGRFEGLKQVQVQVLSGVKTLSVQSSRRSSQGYLLRFASIETPEAARPIIGGMLQIQEERLPPPSEDQYYQYQLLGMDVRFEEGARLGVIKEVLTTNGNAVFVVEDSVGVEHLIPATKELVRSVDVDTRTMLVRPVAGLLDGLDGG
jgi:16S rRNA processing protein RimM